MRNVNKNFETNLKKNEVLLYNVTNHLNSKNTLKSKDRLRNELIDSEFPVFLNAVKKVKKDSSRNKSISRIAYTLKRLYGTSFLSSFIILFSSKIE